MQTDEWVVLNIGGVRYECFVSTLLKVNSMLSAMFTHRDEMKAVRNAAGEYLIDRNGRAFESVMEFLRSGMFVVPPGVSEDVVRAEFDYYGLPAPPRDDKKAKMIDRLLFAKWNDVVDLIWERASEQVFVHLSEIASRGGEEAGVNLVPVNAPDSDERYVALRGKEIGTVWAPSESPVINVLSHSNKSMQMLLAKRFTDEGFNVMAGERPNYFTEQPTALRFLVVSWKHVGVSDFQRLAETVDRIQAHVELLITTKKL